MSSALALALNDKAIPHSAILSFVWQRKGDATCFQISGGFEVGYSALVSLVSSLFEGFPELLSHRPHETRRLPFKLLLLGTWSN